MSQVADKKPRIVAATNKTKKTKRKQHSRTRTVKKITIELDQFARTQRLLSETYGMFNNHFFSKCQTWVDFC
jgi:hypothetical protein